MPCDANELRHIPMFALLDDDELAVLAAHVEHRDFAAKQRIYKAGDPSHSAFLVLSGLVHVTLIDEDNQEVLFGEPQHGDFFGFASMLEDVPHQTTAIAMEATSCIEIDREDLTALVSRKPLAGLDLLTAIAREIHSTQQLVRVRAARNPNQIIDENETFGERIADKVAGFGGSWTFIITFITVMVAYVILNIILVLTRGKTWDPYPFILLNLFLSMLAAIQAPVIMMSQNRQDSKDRVRSELDFDVNRRAESEIQSLSRKLNFLADKVSDLDERLRGPNEPRRTDDLQG
jgi:CRP/FNR family transcriptional regulator, cyclic AMP receptor protein